MCCGYRAECDLDLKSVVIKHQVLKRSFFFVCVLDRVRELCEAASPLVYFTEHATGPTLDDARREDEKEAKRVRAAHARQTKIVFKAKRVASAQAAAATRKRRMTEKTEAAHTLAGLAAPPPTPSPSAEDAAPTDETTPTDADGETTEPEPTDDDETSPLA